MNQIVLINRLMCLALLTLVVGCSKEAPLNTRAGAWHATTDRGEFTLFVSVDGTAITKANYTIKKPYIEFFGENNNTEPWDNPFPIDGRSLFMSISPMGVNVIQWDATFSRNGKKLSGTVHYFPSEKSGGWKERFSIRR